MKRIAIIGSGIAGLTSAYHLSRKHHVTLFEANDYIGGHTHTVDVELEGEKSAIDTGFIVFNDRTYPNFMRLLHELKVAYQPTEMSFSVRNDSIDLEYNGHSLNSLFAQRENLLRQAFWRMLWDIAFFNRQVRRYGRNSDIRTIGDYLETRQSGELFAENYLLPMISAIWSMELADTRGFPLQFFVRFFENHGLLNLVDRPQWYSIVGGSQSYIPAITSSFRSNIRLSSPVKKVTRQNSGVRVMTAGTDELFDEVVIACHGDQALALLENPTLPEQDVLADFSFTDNLVTLHTDTSLLPKRKGAWASWNYNMDGDSGKATLTYNMNILQRLEKRHTYLVTLNKDIAADKTLARFNYSHPAYNNSVIAAQQRWGDISGRDRIHYCGAYWLNGFHEDGVNSALRVCEALGVSP